MALFELHAVLVGHAECERCKKPVRGAVARKSGHAAGPPWCIPCASAEVIREAEEGPDEGTKQLDTRAWDDPVPKSRR
jgi:hypothetical protein